MTVHAFSDPGIKSVTAQAGLEALVVDVTEVKLTRTLPVLRRISPSVHVMVLLGSGAAAAGKVHNVSISTALQTALSVHSKCDAHSDRKEL